LRAEVFVVIRKVVLYLRAESTNEVVFSLELHWRKMLDRNGVGSFVKNELKFKNFLPFSCLE